MPAPHASFRQESSNRVHVLLPLPLAGAYDYRAPPNVDLVPGDFVTVPLGRRVIAGVVWGTGPADAASAVAASRLRDVVDLLPVPRMPLATRRFIDWLARYTCAAPGAVLRMAMSVPSALERPRFTTAYRLAGAPPERMTAARGRVLDVLIDGPPRAVGDLTEAAGVSAGVIKGLTRGGTLEEVAIAETFDVPIPDWRCAGPALTGEQRAAAEALVQTTRAGGYGTTLLDGVTGSGKTEVYFEAISTALQSDRQVLVLLPEIALTAQWLARFEDRFGAAPVTWHSDLKASQRRRHWRAVAEGKARVVVGARSALFLPFCTLGLIVVDEEHDTAFKQDDGVIYHARDMAVVRASLGEFPIVLASATPSLESVINVETGRYTKLHLPNRPGVAELPHIEAVDLRSEPPPRGQWLSQPLRDALATTFEAGDQALLFLNRRGYAPLTLCRTCGHRLACPNCSAWLVEHRFHERLQCHHCGHVARLPENCPHCDDAGSFVACGPGVERLLEEVEIIYPDARAMVVSSDTARGPLAVTEMVRTITEREVDLIIGTQMVAKGHNFPYLTLVGVVDGDLGLTGGDLRASERTYQLLHQVAGRAGRAARPGRALLQTYMPEHPVMQALTSGDRDAFLAAEANARREQGMPPFSRLVALIVSGVDEAAVLHTANALGRAAPRGQDILALGPAPAPFSLLRGRFRYRLLLRTPRRANASELARRWVDGVSAPNSVRVGIDVDPYSFL